MNRPTRETSGGSARQMARAVSISTNRRLPAQNTKPMASAPAAAAPRASSIRVMPHTFTRIMPAVRAGENPLRPRSADGFRADKPVRQNKGRSEEHTSELQSRGHLVCRLLLEHKTQKHMY